MDTSTTQSSPKIKLVVARNGPLRISDPEGLIEIAWSDGESVSPANAAQFSICRCGQSAKKPFCDGAHTKHGFDVARAEVPESAE